MIDKASKNIGSLLNKMNGSLLWNTFLLCFILVLINKPTIYAQVISNNGASVTITSGTFVTSEDLENKNGTLDNDGTIDLSGDFTNLVPAVTKGDGEIILEGDWSNTGTFEAENSTVNFTGSENQTITSSGGETFNNLVIFNKGADPDNRVILSNDVNVSGNFSFSQGNIFTGANTLFLSNPDAASLEYISTTESRIIGKFERGIGSNAAYLFQSVRFCQSLKLKIPEAAIFHCPMVTLKYGRHFQTDTGV